MIPKKIYSQANYMKIINVYNYLHKVLAMKLNCKYNIQN